MPTRVDATIQVKRGPESERINIPFLDGELAYSSDVKRLYIGDGTTPGGNAASSKLYYGAPTDLGTTIGGMVPGDYFLDTTNGQYTSILYALTSIDFVDFPGSYALVCDSNPAVDIYTVVKDNSAFWGAAGGVTFADAQITLASNSAKWDSVYTTVYNNSAMWDSLFGPGGGGTGGGITNVFVVNSIVAGNSAKWNDASTIVQDNSAKWLIQEGIQEEAYFLPGSIATSNQFLQINIDGTIRYIRLWDVSSP
jgi:hypothetical protein